MNGFSSHGPRVLLVSNSRKVGGGATCLLTYANALRERGLAPVVVHPERGVVFDLFAEYGHVCEIAPGSQPAWNAPLAAWTGYRGWQRLIREHHIDIVHANDPSTGRLVALGCRGAGVPFLCHVHFPIEPAFAEWVFRRLPRPHTFAFCSDALRAETGPLLERHYPGIPREVIYNALDTNVFTPRLDHARALGRPRIGIVANLVPVKGHEDFLAMAALLTDRGIDAEYEIVGTEGELGWESHLRTVAGEFGLENRVRFLGYRSDIPAILRDLDVLVCPSHVEPFGRCLIEALACELPVVATRVGGIPEAVGDTAILVPPREPDQLANAVARLLRDDDLRVTLGRAGRRRVIERFGTDALVDHCLELYDRMLTGVPA